MKSTNLQKFSPLQDSHYTVHNVLLSYSFRCRHSIIVKSFPEFFIIERFATVIVHYTKHSTQQTRRNSHMINKIHYSQIHFVGWNEGGGGGAKLIRWQSWSARSPPPSPYRDSKVYDRSPASWNINAPPYILAPSFISAYHGFAPLPPFLQKTIPK